MTASSNAQSPATERCAPFNISIIGSYDATPEQTGLASELGAEIAHLGWNVVCGGRKGVMEAVARGIRSARNATPGGGSTVVVGLLPGSDPCDANPHLDVALPLGIGLARNPLVVAAGDVVVAIGGGAGTLSEIAFAWQFNKPIALLGLGGWVEQLAGKTLDHRRSEGLPHFETVPETVTWLHEMLGRQPRSPF